MSAQSVLDALEGAGLHDSSLVLIDYHAHARRLVLRIEADVDAPGGPRLRTLIFDGVIGLHCDPPNALAPFGDNESGEILRCGAMERPNTEPEVTLVYIRTDHANAPPPRDSAQVAMFRAMGARWVD